MKIFYNKKQMFICTIVTIILCILPYFCNYNAYIYAKSPQNAFEISKNNDWLLFNTYSYLEQKNYEQAVNEFEKINFDNLKINIFNKKLFNEIVDQYQNIIINKAKILEEQKEYKKAVELLENKKKYFSKQNIIETLIKKYRDYFVESGLVKYEGPVEHFFTHCLIAYPAIAFAEDNFMGKNYDIDCLTPNEFKAILKNFYEKNYVLIRASSSFENIDGVIKKKTLYLPKNKKPLILSFDDVNYDRKKLNRGMVDKIVVDSNGELAGFTQKNGLDNQLTYDNEFVPILEQFVKDNPDFSFKGAKGLLCLTGYDGILGYRTNKDSITREQEIEKAKKVVNMLKDKGWEFACHSYGHGKMHRESNANFKEDIKSWKEEVETIIGKTNIYIYPYGEHLIVNKDGTINEKHKMLIDAGFELFCGVGCAYFFGYYPFNSPHAVLFMDRHPLDGQSLRAQKNTYQKYFDCEKIYDNANRTVPY